MIALLRSPISPAIFSVVLLVVAANTEVGPLVFAFGCFVCGWTTALAYAAYSPTSPNQSAPPATSSLPSGGSDPSVTLDYGGAGTALSRPEDK